MIPAHVGFIPDGNRRYARRQGWRPDAAYGLGAEKAVALVDWALEAGVRAVSGYALSLANIALRPRGEVDGVEAKDPKAKENRSFTWENK